MGIRVSFIKIDGLKFQDIKALWLGGLVEGLSSVSSWNNTRKEINKAAIKLLAAVTVNSTKNSKGMIWRFAMLIDGGLVNVS